MAGAWWPSGVGDLALVSLPSEELLETSVSLAHRCAPHASFLKRDKEMLDVLRVNRGGLLRHALLTEKIRELVDGLGVGDARRGCLVLGVEVTQEGVPGGPMSPMTVESDA